MIETLFVNAKMSAYEKNQTNYTDLCRKHTTRVDKDFYRSCPSKLSRRDLEDLYYSLMENNLELKQTINAQTEKNRILSTKVQRMTSLSKNYSLKDCCAAGKAIINEQKAAIADLTKANEVMVDRVRRLSTQLCTAKQFLKQNPGSRNCYKCYVNASTSVKNLSTTSLQHKTSNANLKSLATSAADLDKEPHPTRTAEMSTSEKEVENYENEEPEKVCNENKCRTTMAEFKQKIQDLEEELAKTHTEYSSRMTQLESQVSALEIAAMRSRSDLNQRARQEAQKRARELRDADAGKVELETQLSLEKKKVSELEMRLKAAEVSQQVAQTIEGHLSAANRLEEKQLRQPNVQHCSVSTTMAPGDGTPQKNPPTSTLTGFNVTLTVPDDKLSKSDDSGYVEHRQESDHDKSDNKENQELLEKIRKLQAQLDALKLSSAKKYNAEIDALPCPEIVNSDNIDSIEEQGNKQSKVSPKRTIIDTPAENLQTNIRNEYTENENAKEASVTPEDGGKNTCTHMKNKPKASNKASVPFKILSCCNDKKSDSDSDSNTVRKENELDKHSREVVETSASTSRDYKSKDVNQSNVSNKEKHTTNLPKLNLESEERSSGYEGNNEGLNIEVKPVNNKVDKQIDNEVRDYKSNRNSQVLFRKEMVYTPDEINEQDTTEESGNIRHPIIHTCKDSRAKGDDSNFQQIPGPLPVGSSGAGRQNNASNKIAAENRQKAKKYGKRRIADRAENKNKMAETQTNASPRKEHIDNIIPNNKNDISGDSRNKIANDNHSIQRKTRYDNDIKEESANNSENHPLNDSNENNRTAEKQIWDTVQELPTRIGAQTKVTDKGTGYEFENGSYMHKKLQVLDKGAELRGQGVARRISRVDEFEICQHHVTICTCPEKPSQSLTMFRSCDGTLTVASPLISGTKFRRCECSERISRCSGGPRDAPVATSTPLTKHGAVSPNANTYTLDSADKTSRATSPANTDNEISVMTDLPSEKEDDTPNGRLSPGEKADSPSTDIISILRDAGQNTLSEGEVPGGKYSGCRASKSIGEVQTRDGANEELSAGEQKSSTEKMEAALQMISEELARCRWLLQTKGSKEQPSKDVGTGLDRPADSINLRKSSAQAHLFGETLPACLFIIHITTVVLAEKAVAKLGDARFVLSWKFHDEDTSSTRIGVGRVIHYKFCTQYDLELTKAVVEYLSKEDLVISIYEVDKADKPLGTCSLPLQKVLANVNRRVHFSLPLRAGLTLTDTQFSPFEAVGDDIGMVDLWCLLHCDQTLALNNTSNGQVPSTDDQVVGITVLWLTLNQNCEAMLTKDDRKLYVAYTFLGRDEAELETPISLPKPERYFDKCIYNFRKTFHLTEIDMQILQHMTCCRSRKRKSHNSKDCIVFSVVSEPPEDPLGLENCEDIGFAFLYLGDLLARSSGDSFTEVLPVRAARALSSVCGVLAVEVDGLYVLRACKDRIGC